MLLMAYLSDAAATAAAAAATPASAMRSMVREPEGRGRACGARESARSGD